MTRMSPPRETRRGRGRRLLARTLAVVMATTSMGVAMTVTAPASRAQDDLTGYVNPFIGTAGGSNATGQSYPGATTPFGMIQWSPDTDSEEEFQYAYESTTQAGFSLTHYTGYGPRIVNFVPFVGSVSTSPGDDPSDYYSTFSHDDEVATPGYYEVKNAADVTTKLSTTTRAGLGTFTYPTGKTATMILNLGDSPASTDKAIYNKVTIDAANKKITGFAGKSSYKLHFVAQFTHDFATYGTFDGDKVTSSGTTTSTATDVGSYVTFDTSTNATVGVKVGVSYVSVENAAANLAAEIASDATLATVKAAAKSTWNTYLNKFKVTDANALNDDLVQYYTHLYFFLTQPNTISDTNREYWGADNAKHTVAEGHTQYTGVSSWDHGRSYWPLLSLLLPSVASDAMQSLIDAGQQRAEHRTPGFLYPFLANGVSDGYGGNDFAIPAQVYAFKARDFDTKEALRQQIEAATSKDGGRGSALTDYLSKGYVPGTEGPGETLEFALSDFAISQFARALGDTANADLLSKRSDNWRNTWLSTASDNGYTGYVWRRKADGTFEDFSQSESTAGVEASAQQLSYLVPHNAAALITLMGGKSTFVERLDAYMDSADVGNNEPDMQVPWLYNWAGEPAKAQSAVRTMMLKQFQNKTNGFPGNNDWGSMSAYYLQSVLGLYPSIQGVGGFSISSPLFAKVTLQLEGGKSLTITGENASRTKKYIQSAAVNGTSYGSPWIPIDTLLSTTSNTLAFVLGDTASSWGSNPTTNAPPSYPPSTLTDIALNKTVTANGTACNTTSETPGKAVDGSTGTKWCQALVSGSATLTLDLGQGRFGASSAVSGFGLRSAGSENGSYVTKDFKIEYSDDGTTWIDVPDATVTGNTTNDWEKLLPRAFNTRFIRLNLTTPAQNSDTAARVYSFNVYGTTDPAVAHNVAYKRSATANGSPCASGEGPEKATDDSTSSIWCQAAVSGQAVLTVDLGSPKAVSGYRMSGYPHDSKYIAKDFTFQYSTGNASGPWTAFSGADVTGNSQQFLARHWKDANIKKARYVRLVVTTPEQGSGTTARIANLQVFGVPVQPANLAKDRTASGNGTACNTTSESPAKAVDGNTGTKWCQPLVSGTASLKVDLSKVVSVGGFSVRSAGSESSSYITKDFTIEYSADGTDSGTWTAFSGSTVTGNTTDVWSTTLPAPVDARYVRLRITAPQQGTGGAARIYEFEVQGSATE